MNGGTQAVATPHNASIMPFRAGPSNILRPALAPIDPPALTLQPAGSRATPFVQVTCGN